MSKLILPVTFSSYPVIYPNNHLTWSENWEEKSFKLEGKKMKLLIFCYLWNVLSTLLITILSLLKILSQNVCIRLK